MRSLPILLLAAVTGLRLWAATKLPVTPVEAYHWMAANRLDWAFFDGPGGTAALAHLGSLLCGDDAFGLRLAFPLLAALATIGAYLLGRAWNGPLAGLWVAVALNALPVFNVSAIHVGPEMPALAFSTLGLWALGRALERGRLWWILTGLFFAAAAQFTYATLAVIPGILLALGFSSRHRTEFRHLGIYFTLVLIAAGTVPAILWNQAHSWPATALGTWRTEFTPDWPGAGRAGLATLRQLSLPAVVAILFAGFLLVRAARLHSRPRLALFLATPFLLLWLRGILHGDEAPTALLLGAIILVAAALGGILETLPRRRIAAGALLLTAALTALAPAPPRDPWPSVATALTPLLTEVPAERPAPLFLIAPDPAATAALSYHLSRLPSGATHPVFLRESQDLSNQFGLWPRYDDFIPTDKPTDEFFKLEGNSTNPYLGRSALYLTEESPDDLPQTITAAFARVTPTATLTLPDGRKLRVYLCEDYQTMPL